VDRARCGGHALASTNLTFVNRATLDKGTIKNLGLKRRLEPVKRTRKIGKRDMVLNDALPELEVDPETSAFKADGEALACEPAKVLPMARRYSLF
jgi:urease subunit alpha